MSQTDYYLKIEGIPGEAKDSKHKDSIDILTFAWGESQGGTFGHGGGGGAGKVKMGDFMFTMRTNKASPELMLACASGRHIAKAVLTCRKAAGKEAVEYLICTFTNIFISSFNISGPAPENLGPIPIENVTINFAQVELEYNEQTDQGPSGVKIKRGWNWRENKQT